MLLMAVDDGLDRVAQEFADDVLEVAEDVGEAGFKVAVNLDLGDLHVRAVGVACEGDGGFGTTIDDVLGDAFDKDLADEVGL